MSETKTIWAKKPQKKVALLQELLIIILVGTFAYSLYHLIDLFRMIQLYVDDLLIYCIVLCIIAMIFSIIVIIIVLKLNNKQWTEVKFKKRKTYPKEEKF